MTVAHFPPFDTLTTCPTCVGLGCNDCCHTGRADIPPANGADIPLTLHDEPRAESESRQGGDMTPTEARERLAAIEHEQWMTWAKAVAPEVDGLRAERWQAYMVPYDQLPEDVKDHDRKWADKVLAVLAADPTIVCPDPEAHALADAVRRLADECGNAGWMEIYYGPGPNGYRWEVVAGSSHDLPPMPRKQAAFGDTLEAAIAAALEGDR